MANSVIKGSLSGVATSNVQPALEWSSKPNTTGNYSDVTAILVFYRYNTSWQSWNANGHSVTFKLDGNSLTQSKTFDIRGTSRDVVWTRTLRVYHDSNGSKSISISASGNTGTSLGSYNFSGTATLDTIPRASRITSLSSFSVLNGEITTFNLNISRESSSFTHYIALYVDGTYIQNWSDQGLPSSLAITAANSSQILKVMRYKTSATAELRVQTKSGSTNVGSVVSRTTTASIHSSLVPTIDSVSISESVADIATNLGVYVQGKSKLVISLVTTPTYGARDGSFKVMVDGRTYTSKSFTTSLLTSSGTKTISIEYINTRGQKVTTTRNVTIYAYTSPYPQITAAYRSDINGLADENGAYGTIEYSAVISSLNLTNDAIVQARYKQTDETSFTDQIVSDGVYSATGAFTFLASEDYTHDIQIVATDHFASIPTFDNILSTFTLINFAADGKGMALGRAYDESLGGIFQLEGRELPKVIAQHSAEGGTHTIPITERGIYLVTIAPSSTLSTAKVAMVHHWYDTQIAISTIAAGSSGISIVAKDGSIDISYNTWFTFSVVKLGS